MDAIKNITWFIKKNKKSYIISIFSIMLSYLFVPIPIYYIGKIVDLIRDQALDRQSLNLYISIVVISVLLQYSVDLIWNYYIFGNSYKFGRDNRRKIMRKLLDQNPEFYFKNSTGSLMSKATHDVSNLQMMLGYGILALFDATIYPLSLIFVMGFTISWKLTLASIIVLPTMIYFSARLGEILDKRFTKIQKSMERLNESVLEHVNSIRVIKGFSTQDITRQSFNQKAIELSQAMRDQNRLSALFFPIGRIIPGITFVIAFILGERMLAGGQISLGQLVSFFSFLNMLVWPMFAFGDLINVYQESSSSVRRIQALYDYKEDYIEKENLQEYKAKADVEFKNFSFTYPGDKYPALEDISFTIKKGQTFGIVGKIGSGKTSLVKQLLRYYNVQEDSLLMDGRSVEDYSRSSIRDKIGYVPQNHILFSKPVGENIAFSVENASKSDIEKAVEFSDFTKDLHTLPQGLDTIIGEKGVSVSGGQKQRISISRAIIKDPEILILDDSLSAVDAITEKNIIDNIKRERVGKTTIIVAHRLSALKDADNIIVLDSGKISEQGNHEDLLNQKGWYYEQYTSQSLGGLNEND